jgi:hypothetical protein
LQFQLACCSFLKKTKWTYLESPVKWDMIGKLFLTLC